MIRHNAVGLSSTLRLKSTARDREHAPPARGPEPAAPPGSGAPSAVLGACDEPEAEPDVSVTSSAAVRLRERLAAAVWMLRAHSAGDDTGAVTCCSAECAGMAAASRVARARWNTRVLPWVTWPCACVCAAARTASASGAAAGCAALLCLEGLAVAAPARRACCLRLRAAVAAAWRLAMQDLPRGPVQALRTGQARLHISLACHSRCNCFKRPVLALTRLHHSHITLTRSCNALTSVLQPTLACAHLFHATLVELSRTPCYIERMT